MTTMQAPPSPQHVHSDPRPWHALPAGDALVAIGGDPAGLSDSEVTSRLARYGPNELPRGRRDGIAVLIWRQVNNPLIWILLASSAVAVALGKVIDGAVVMGVVVLNTIIGALQEFRAGRAIEALAAMVPENATVLRAGQRAQVPAVQLVPGDLVELQSGDKVPADLRLLTTKSLKVQEAALTGESLPVDKLDEPADTDASLGDRRGMAYSGTLVSYGTGRGVVVATGATTELGRISSMLNEATEFQTPLTRQMAAVAKWLTIAIVFVALIMMGVGLYRGYPLVEAIIAAVALAVAAIPEGLPAIITIALAIGVARMAKRRAIIRKLPAVETLGSTTVICSDKTGTLTRNEMTVQALWTPGGGGYRLGGIGYEPRGELTRDAVTLAAPPQDVRDLLAGGVLCNDAALRQEDNAWHVTGDPTEGAMVVAGEKASLDTDALRKRHPRVDVIPFESERQYMATMHDVPEAGRVIYLKGAPEVVLSRCSVASGERLVVLEEVERLAAEGMRVLAVAQRRVDASQRAVNEADIDGGFDLLGLQGMIDPPRPEAMAAIRDCHAAGITVKMITGDHAGTAAAIGRQLGLISAGAAAVTGKDLERMDEARLAETVNHSNVFARVAPEHKLRLVRALQNQRHVVAMTGDGVNDAPALKQSDIGVAMGITGTSVSKESADVVLTDDNFASIAAAVEEGRRVYDNLIKSLAFVLPTNLGLALILLSAVVAFPLVGGLPLLPMEPVQILWINLVATVALALPLAFEAMERDVMRRPPRKPDSPILGAFVLFRTGLVGVMMAAGGVGLFLYEYYLEEPLVGHELALAEAQTMAVTTVILFQIFYLLNCRSLKESFLKIGLFSNNKVYLGIAALLGLQAAFMYVPAMNALFGSAPLNADAWIKSLAVAAIVLPVITIEKWLRQRRA